MSTPSTCPTCDEQAYHGVIVERDEQERWACDACGYVHAECAALPCPEWCELSEGHPFAPATLAAALGLSEGDGVFRVHERRYGELPTHVVAEAWERAVSVDGPSDLGTDAEAYVIRVQFPNGHGYVTAPGARRLAEFLAAAADLIEER